jgi:hypothetical protein
VELSTLTTEYVRVPVAAEEDGATVDPTAATVEMAFPAEDVDPVEADWQDASWETVTTSSPDTYLARVLVGTGDLDLAAGNYDVWVRITSSPETVVRKAGRITLT